MISGEKRHRYWRNHCCKRICDAFFSWIINNPTKGSTKANFFIISWFWPGNMSKNSCRSSGHDLSFFLHSFLLQSPFLLTFYPLFSADDPVLELCLAGYCVNGECYIGEDKKMHCKWVLKVKNSAGGWRFSLKQSAFGNRRAVMDDLWHIPCRCQWQF